MAPSPKMNNIAAKSPTAPQASVALSPAVRKSESPNSTRKIVKDATELGESNDLTTPSRKTISSKRRDRKSPKPLISDPFMTVDDMLKLFKLPVRDLKTPVESLRDEYNLFSDQKSIKKQNSSNRRGKKSPKPIVSTPCMSLDDILKDDEEPEPLWSANKSFIEGVFDKWMEQDPYATLSRYLPVSVPQSPERPLTMFSPVKDKSRTFAAPQVRSRARRALYSPTGEDDQLNQNRPENWAPLSVSTARKEMLHGATHKHKCNPSSQLPPSCSTPSRPLLFTGEPVSGVKALFHDKYSPCSVTSTPAQPTEDTRLNLKSILTGITCFVEVRYIKEDRSEWVRMEVASLGAKVQKTFSKKVTHVIFKEGKISTYMMAKELNVPIVSVSWIEACKKAGGLVDPLLYPPMDDDKYQRDTPVAEAKKRRRFLDRGWAFLDRLNGILPPKPPRSRTKKRSKPSATEGKRKKKVVNAKTQQNKRPKKLNFNNPGVGRCADKKSTDNEKALRDQRRRKSAPADLVEAGQQKLTRFFPKETEKTKQKTQDLLQTPPKSSDEGPWKDL